MMQMGTKCQGIPILMDPAVFVSRTVQPSVETEPCRPSAQKPNRGRVQGSGFEVWGLGLLVHGWDGIKNVHLCSFLGLRTHKKVKCYPTVTKVGGSGLGVGGSRLRRTILPQTSSNPPSNRTTEPAFPHEPPSLRVLLLGSLC